jgi:hypothetical protein
VLSGKMNKISVRKTIELAINISGDNLEKIDREFVRSLLKIKMLLGDFPEIEVVVKNKPEELMLEEEIDSDYILKDDDNK